MSFAYVAGRPEGRRAHIGDRSLMTTAVHAFRVTCQELDENQPVPHVDVDYSEPISPNNVLRRAIFPACERLEIPRATWLTFRRTYPSWSHDRGVPGKVVAQLMGTPMSTRH
jgi:hypothetical protein